MAAAMDVTGNASSIHAEGRAMRALIERARAQVPRRWGPTGCEIVFTSGATEAAALACAGRDLQLWRHRARRGGGLVPADLPVDKRGPRHGADPERDGAAAGQFRNRHRSGSAEGLAVSDLTQGFGKLPFAFNWLGCAMGLVSAHKLGGRGRGRAWSLRPGLRPFRAIRGGGQEMGRRAGTENVIGIAGFGAAAEAAARDLAEGVWDEVAQRLEIF
jgi:cysteine desulfurase